MTRFVVLAVLGALMIAVGAGWWVTPPLGLLVGGAESIIAAYLGLYFTAKGVLSAKATKP